MILLGVNIDHIATIRQARKTIEPEPLFAAMIAEAAGADQITVHLREDARHIQKRDVCLLKQTLKTKLNLEMALNEEVINTALEVKPDSVTLVPEKREELTTEGGLNILNNSQFIKDSIEKIKSCGIEVSLFLEPDLKIIELAHQFGADAVELHTGTFANLKENSEIEKELERISKACDLIKNLKMRVVAGHGITYQNIDRLVALRKIQEYNIGHSIIARAVFYGLNEAVSTMKKLINQ